MSDVVVVRDAGKVLIESPPKTVSLRDGGQVTPVLDTWKVITLHSGPPGPQGPQGDANVVVSDTNPNFTEPGLWIETKIGPNNDITFWVEDGTA